ncbi:hypothetical protein AVEN_160767-1 [Araneus ventricosus]|uniref:Uncharacterized protein n=1 Tax=Araneus ventricosus TaxID=182803 RepID=A0A4Y2UPC0_ARAVE|nr:hypothetical protein AVEN_160767-1 [Araneus ventricosus]
MYLLFCPFRHVPVLGVPELRNKRVGREEYDSWEKETLAVSTVNNFLFTTMNANLPRARSCQRQRTGMRTPQSPNTFSIKSLPALIARPRVPPAPSLGRPG